MTDQTSTLIQQFSRNIQPSGKKSIVREENRGIPSAHDKTADVQKTGNTNLGSVVRVSKSSHSVVKEECIVTRSGRSNSGHRLKEAVLHAAMEQLSTETKRGLVAVEGKENEFEFTHHITSYLDPSTFKATTSLIQKAKQSITRSKGNIENERDFLKEMLQARDTWKDETITLQHEGKEIVVHLKRPIISDELFSSTVRGVHFSSQIRFDMGQADRDRIEFCASGQLLQKALAQGQLSLEVQHGLVVKNAAKKLQEKFGERKIPLRNGVIDFERMQVSELLDPTSELRKIFASQEMKEYREALAQFYGSIACPEGKKNEEELGKYLQEKASARIAAALYTTTFRRVLEGGVAISSQPPQAAKEEAHAADIEIWRNMLLDDLRISKGKQCKSGTDRTGIGVALAEAASEFRSMDVEKKRIFIPGFMKGEELIDFKLMFRKCLIEHGLAVTVETKGYSGLKLIEGVKIFGGKGNPVPLKYLINRGDTLSQSQKNDFKNYFGYEWDEKRPDTTLTQEKIEAGGLQQYDGQFSDAYLFASKVKGAPRDKLSIADREAALTPVLNDLKEILEESSFLKEQGRKVSDLFEDNLNLKPHVKKLGFSKENDTYRKQKEAIEKKIKEYEGIIQQEKDQEKEPSTALQYQMYALKQILWLADQYRESDRMLKSALSSGIIEGKMPSSLREEERLEIPQGIPCPKLRTVLKEADKIYLRSKKKTR